MPVLLGLLAAAAGVIFWIYRARDVAHVQLDSGRDTDQTNGL